MGHEKNDSNGSFQVVEYTPEEEQKLVRKLDFWIIPLMLVTNALNFLDKSTFQAAALFGMVEDLDLVTTTGTTSDGDPVTDNTRYSIATMIFSIGFIVGAYPWSLLSQKFPPGKVASVACIIWSVIGLTTPSCRGYGDVLANRFFLGTCEAAISPIFTVYVTYWWNRKEQVLRSALWYCATGLASIIGPVLGWGVSKIDGPLKSWKYMFYIINSVSLLWGFIILVFLPGEPSTTSRFFLSERERDIAVERMRRNQAGSTEKKFQWKQLKEALTDHNFWFIGMFICVVSAPVNSLTSFATLIIKGFGFDSSMSLLLTIPLGAVSVISLLTTSVISRYKLGLRYYFMIGLLAVQLIGLFMSWLSTSPGVRMAGLILFPCSVGSAGLCVSLASSNVAGNTKKYLVSSIAFIGQCLGGIMGALVFGSSPGPKFNSGFIGNVVFTIFCIIIAIGSRIWFSRENKHREREFGPPGVSGEAANFEQDSTDKENRKNFRYVL